jgi:hypothetical protein
MTQGKFNPALRGVWQLAKKQTGAESFAAPVLPDAKHEFLASPFLLIFTVSSKP